MNKETTFTPPIEVQANARRALEYRSRLTPSKQAMTPVGVTRARQLAAGRPQTLETIGRMHSFFARHSVDNHEIGSKGWQAWMGWGGDAGRRWVERILGNRLKDEPAPTPAQKASPSLESPPPLESIELAAQVDDTPELPAEMPMEEPAEESAEEPAGGMAIGQLRAIAKKATEIAELLTPESTLEPWVSSLISVAAFQMNAVSDFMLYSNEGTKVLTEATNANTQKGIGMNKTLHRNVIQKSLTKPSLGGKRNESPPEGLFLKFAHFEKANKDQQVVVGYASSERIDGQNDIVDSEALHQALDDYMQWANLREMHQPKAIGKVLQATPVKGKIKLSDGTVLINPLRIIAKIVDDDAWQKVKSGILKGFSIGGKVVNAVTQKINGKDVRRITGLTLNEISLVDRPANPDARIVMMKRDSQVLDKDTLEIMVKSGNVDDLMKAAKQLDPAEILPMIQLLRNQSEIDGDLDTAERYNEVITLMLEAMGVIPTGTVREVDDMESNVPDDDADDMVDMEAIYNESSPDESKAQKRRNSFMYADEPTDILKVGRTISKSNMDVLADILSAANIIRTLCARLGLQLHAEEVSEHSDDTNEGEHHNAVAIAIKPVESAIDSQPASAEQNVLDAIDNAPKKSMPGNNTGNPIHTAMNPKAAPYEPSEVNPDAPAQNVESGYPLKRNAQNDDLQKQDANADANAVDITGLEKEMQSMELNVDNATPVATDESVNEQPPVEKSESTPVAPTIDVTSALQEVIAKSLGAALAGTVAQLDAVVKTVERIEATSNAQTTATKEMIAPVLEKVAALESVADSVKQLSERLTALENQPATGNAPVLRGQTVNKAMLGGSEDGGKTDEISTLNKMMDETHDPLVRTKLRERLALLETKKALFGRV